MANDDSVRHTDDIQLIIPPSFGRMGDGVRCNRYTITALAAMANVSEQTARSWIVLGKIPFPIIVMGTAYFTAAQIQDIADHGPLPNGSFTRIVAFQVKRQKSNRPSTKRTHPKGVKP